MYGTYLSIDAISFGTVTRVAQTFAT